MRSAERPSFVPCHWSFAAATNRRGDGGWGTRGPPKAGRPWELPKRQTAADGRVSRFGIREPASGIRGSRLVARRSPLVAPGPMACGFGIRGPGTRQRRADFVTAVLCPNGAADCSHGWSTGRYAAGGAEPVGAFVFQHIRPERAEEVPGTGVLSSVPKKLLRPAGAKRG